MTDGHPWVTCTECGSDDVEVWASPNRVVRFKCNTCGARNPDND